jgi:Cu-processing system permease protein
LAWEFVLIYQFDATGISLVLVGCMLSLVFASIAFLASVKSRDKARGSGVALLLWFYFTLIFDGLLILLLFAFSDYPLEKFTLIVSSLNPIDLGRIFIMLQNGCKRINGYTGRYIKISSEAVLGCYTLWVL